MNWPQTHLGVIHMSGAPSAVAVADSLSTRVLERVRTRLWRFMHARSHSCCLGRDGKLAGRFMPDHPLGYLEGASCATAASGAGCVKKLLQVDRGPDAGCGMA